ncbi:gamma-butyrobetaine dioxygenase-like [Pecten maximus]|uniref:gamma-butyrobetaine dioxygenase-like n=1 Tax=Pecten maximus TaxID=6579 RepID=UPI001458C429|nr:gamma-butyrobetaine dioxygenase-like [Pecten maximus]XP_033739853.1 gamma-butyrobetaine dioxygenase-like [Pecten maximus]
MLKSLCRRRLLTVISRCSSVQFTGQKGPSVPLITSPPCNASRRHGRHQSFSVRTPSFDKVAETASVSDCGHNVKIAWDNGSESRFHAVWLRHHCPCQECYSTTVNQVLIDIDNLPLEIKATGVRITEKGRVQIDWDDDHTGEFASAFLRKYCYSHNSLAEKKTSIKTSLYKESSLPCVKWADCEADEKYVYRWLKDINEHGLAMVNEVPTTSNMLTEFIPKHLAPLLDNTYGKIYDVIVMEDPTNLAYTRTKLQFHMDLPYYESAPGIQFLHCLKFDDSLLGGETIFVDMFAVCEEFRHTSPTEFKTLCSVPCTFVRDHESRDEPIHLLIQRPIINLNNEEEVIGVFWNPGVVGVLEVPEDDVADYYRAYQLFARAISNFHTKNEVRLKPGDLVAFNNRRMAHSRNAFTYGSGERHFQGCYVNICEYKSRLVSLTKKYGDVSTIKRVGNMDWM